MFSSLITFGRRAAPSVPETLKRSARLCFGNSTSIKQATTSILWKPEFVLLTGGLFTWVHITCSYRLHKTFGDQDRLFGGPGSEALAQIHDKYLIHRMEEGAFCGILTLLTGIGAWLEPARVTRHWLQYTARFPSGISALCTVVGGSAVSVLLERSDDSLFGVALRYPEGSQIVVGEDWFRSMDRLDLSLAQRQALQSERWNNVINFSFVDSLWGVFSLRVVFYNLLAHTNPYTAVGVYLGLVGSLLCTPISAEGTSFIPVLDIIYECELCLSYLATGRLVVPLAIHGISTVFHRAKYSPSSLPFTIEGKCCGHRSIGR